MKKIIFIFFFTFSLSSFAQSNSSVKNSWALAYGYGKNKNEKNFTPKGSTYKFIYGLKTSNIEMSVKLGFSDLENSISYNNKSGKLVHQDKSGGIQFGYWLFDRLNLHVGYAIHNINEFVSGDFSNADKRTIEGNYKLEDFDKPGVYGGGELILLKGSFYHFFASYDYYHINEKNSNDWEVLGGFRFYIGANPNSSSEKNIFSKVMGWLLDGK